MNGGLLHWKWKLLLPELGERLRVGRQNFGPSRHFASTIFPQDMVVMGAFGKQEA